MVDLLPGDNNRPARATQYKKNNKNNKEMRENDNFTQFLQENEVLFGTVWTFGVIFRFLI